MEKKEEAELGKLYKTLPSFFLMLAFLLCVTSLGLLSIIRIFTLLYIELDLVCNLVIFSIRSM